MSDIPYAIRLNANQRRHFEVLFARLEESLAKVESLMVSEGPRDFTMGFTEDDLPSAFRKTAPPLLDQLRSEIAQLTSVLELRRRSVSRRRTIAAILTAEAVRFEDSLASQMRGYGAVDPSVEQHLDPRLEGIARTLNVLAKSLKATHTRSTE
ncbi:MAG TPA: hypothetical protein VIK50_10725 [Gemmatimonadaceae bacterium]